MGKRKRTEIDNVNEMDGADGLADITISSYEDDSHKREKKKKRKKKKSADEDDKFDAKAAMSESNYKKLDKVKKKKELKLTDEVDLNSYYTKPNTDTKDKKKNSEMFVCNVDSASLSISSTDNTDKTTDHKKDTDLNRKEKKKRKHKDDHSGVDVCDSLVAEPTSRLGGVSLEQSEQCDRHKSKKKRKKHKRNDEKEIRELGMSDAVQEVRERSGCETYETEDVNQSVKKKKKQKRKHVAEERDEDVSDFSISAAVTVNGSGINDYSLSCAGDSDQKKEEKKRNKDKKGKKRYTGQTSVDEQDSSPVKKKKKEKQDKEDGDGGHLKEIDEDTSSKKKLKRDRKDKQKNVNEVMTSIQENTENKKRKDRTFNEEGDNDGCRAKSNAKVNGDIPENSSGSNKGSAAGQWSGDMFQDKNRQEKFIRLLGGFKKSSDEAAPQKKKGLYGSLSLLSSSRNQAMDQSQADQLNQRLESQYEKAMSFHMNKAKGIGLGYEASPGEGKKFHIDKTQCKSRKFADDD